MALSSIASANNFFSLAFSSSTVLNTTNKNELVEKLSRKPADWIGALVGLYVDPNVTYAGKRVAGLRLRVLGPGTKPAVSAGPPEPPLHERTGIEDMNDNIPI